MKRKIKFFIQRLKRGWSDDECWDCEDKSCEHYKSKRDLYFENKKLKGVIETYEILIKANNINNWNELKSWLKEQYKLNDLMYYNDRPVANPKKARIEYISKREELKEILDKMQELEGNNE